MKKMFYVLVVSLSLVLTFCSSSTNNNPPDDDTTSPTLSSAESADYTTVKVQFSEDVDETSAETTGNYSLVPPRPSGLTITAAARDVSDASVVNLTLSKTHLPLEYTLTVNHVKDIAQNEIAENSETTFTGNGKVAFVSAATGNGDLSAWADSGEATGLAAADNICQTEADTAGLNGTFVAWLSTDTSEAIDRLGVTSGPWVRTDGYPLAENLADFYDGKTLVPLRLDAQENTVTVSSVWSNTDEEGTAVNSGSGTHDCLDWNSSVSGGDNGSGYTGSAAGVAYAWTNLGSYGCSGTSHIYCFQTGAGPAMPPYGTTGKIAFVTSTTTIGNFGGITQGNDICMARAAAASLSGTFKVWLSDNTQNAKDVLASLTGPWVLLNGVKVADDLDDLTDGDLFAPIYLTEIMTYAEAPAWTGTLSGGTTAGDTLACDNWTDGTAGASGQAGHAPRSDETWTEFYSPTCNNALRLYCLEE